MSYRNISRRPPPELTGLLAGIGLEVLPGDVLLRCNFATLAESGAGLSIRDRRAGRIQEGTEELATVLRDLPLGDGVNGRLYPTTQHRAVLALRGGVLSSAVSDTDPAWSPQILIWKESI